VTPAARIRIGTGWLFESRWAASHRWGDAPGPRVATRLIPSCRPHGSHVTATRASHAPPAAAPAPTAASTIAAAPGRPFHARRAAMHTAATPTTPNAGVAHRPGSAE